MGSEERARTHANVALADKKAFMRNGFGMAMLGPSTSSRESGLVGEGGWNSIWTGVPRWVLKNVESCDAGDSGASMYICRCIMAVYL